MVKNAPKKIDKEINNNKFYCQICDYSVSRKSQLDRHKKSKKHQKNLMKNAISKDKNGNKLCTLVENQCSICFKKYKHRSGLSRHYKNCIKTHTNSVENESKNYHSAKFTIENGTKCAAENNDGDSILKEKIQVLELEKKILEKDLECAKTIGIMKDQMLETLKTNATTNNNYKDCAINNTQNININLFLNKDCKNAMNLEDFVDNIKVQLEDILYQGEVGAAEGITNIITKQLQDMPVTRRPIHCTDEKRLQFYVREKEEWNKKKDWTHEEVLNMRNKIKNKQIMAMDEWEDKNEGFTKDPKLQEEYTKIMGGILEGYEDDKKMKKQIKKLRKNLAKHVGIKEAIKEHTTIDKKEEVVKDDEEDFSFGEFNFTELD